MIWSLNDRKLRMAASNGLVPHLASSYMQLAVTLDHADLNTTGLLKPDPYVEIIVDGKPPKKTEIYKSSYHPKWQAEISVIVTAYSKLVFRVYNHSTFKKDSLLGEIFNLAQFQAYTFEPISKYIP